VFLFVGKAMLRRWRCCSSAMGASVAISGPVGSRLLPPVTVSIWRKRRRHFRRKIEIFGVVNVRVHQRFLVMLFGEQHVERRNDEQREDGTNAHPANENETNGISRGGAGTA